MPKRSGYTQIYTGEGKGKTTAAMGLALRAVGAGMKVCFIQLLKGRQCSEHKVLKKMTGLTLKQYGSTGFVRKKPTPKDIGAAQAGLAAVIQALLSGQYDMVVADEICVAGKLGLLAEADILEAMCARPAHVEMILTGRDATPAMIRMADLVTVMQAKKHYFNRGISARPGIEH
jgi:cob(I)alamin adenosyltransferase